MLSTHPAHRQHGVTLIELMIAIAILGILLALGVPSYRTWIQNTQIRNAAESIKNGLQLTRAEAVRRNMPVELVLTDTAPTEANVNAIAASANGRGWIIRVYETSGAYSASDFIQGRARSEGSTNTTVTTSPSTSNFRFIGFGRLVTPAASTNIDITATGGDRSLRVVVSPGGEIRMCDPAVVDTNDPRIC